MNFTAYFENNYMVSFKNYEKMKAETTLTKRQSEIETIIVRKLRFENINLRTHVDEEPLPVFSICMKNHEEDSLYLEKQSRENNITYKVMDKISKKECERILSGDIDWMKTSGKTLLHDLYYQITVNGLMPERIEEYEREIVKKREFEYIGFNKRIRVAGERVTGFFNRHLHMTDCLAWDEILVTYKCEMKTPFSFKGIIHMEIEENSNLAFSF